MLCSCGIGSTTDAQRTEDAVIDTATLLTSSHNCSNTLVVGCTVKFSKPTFLIIKTIKIMNAITSFRLCKLSTHDLITKIDEQTDNIFKNQEVPVRHIPARPDADFDLLIGELILRFGELEAFIKSVESDLTFIDENADIGQTIYNTRRKISMLLAAEYGKAVV